MCVFIRSYSIIAVIAGFMFSGYTFSPFHHFTISPFHQFAILPIYQNGIFYYLLVLSVDSFGIYFIYIIGMLGGLAVKNGTRQCRQSHHQFNHHVFRPSGECSGKGIFARNTFNGGYGTFRRNGNLVESRFGKLVKWWNGEMAKQSVSAEHETGNICKHIPTFQTSRKLLPRGGG